MGLKNLDIKKRQIENVTKGMGEYAMWICGWMNIIKK
jgi:hypothetical protein